MNSSLAKNGQLTQNTVVTPELMRFRCGFLEAAFSADALSFNRPLILFPSSMHWPEGFAT